MNSAYNINDIIKQYFLDQNSILAAYRSIRVDNIFGLDAKLTEIESGTTTSIREIFVTSKDGKHPFKNVTQYNSKRVNFLVKKEQEDWANNIIHEFLYDYLDSNITPKIKESYSAF